MKADPDQLYLVTGIEGYTPQISYLLSMMNYARHTTISAVEGLTTEQLDDLVDSQSNSIGALLLHFAAVEYAYQVETFEQRELTKEEIAKWGPALDLGEEGRRAIKGNDLNYYLRQMEEVRNRSYQLFRRVDDEWLFQEEEFWHKKQANYYFMWFHVLEDEINHRGQIRWMRKRLLF